MGQKIEYSNIKVELYNKKNGFLKDSTTCLPTGLYVLPIYDFGEYLLQVKGPEGWTFGILVDHVINTYTCFEEPKQVQITINEQMSTCGKDINFVLNGFTVFGKVSCLFLNGSLKC